jgi:hypothetical protein
VLEEFYLLKYNTVEACSKHTGFLLGLFFDSEDGGDMSL